MSRHSLRFRVPAAAGGLRRGDEGFAMVAVLVLGVCLIALSSVLVIRGTRAAGNTSGDARWERALAAAEAGLEMGLQALEVDAEFSTTGDYPGPFASPEDERGWVVETADAASGDDLVETPSGEYAVVKPAGVNLLYAVGYSPSREAFGRRTRVVRIGYELHQVPWDLEFALLVGDGLNLSGSTLIVDSNGNDSANVHSNGDVYTGGNWEVEGCLTTSDENSDLADEPGCPDNPLPREEIPDINPMVLYTTAQVVLCLDGKAYAGPAYPDTTKRDNDNQPCNFPTEAERARQEVPLAGWSSKLQGGVRTWDPSNATLNGVYYVHQANVDGKTDGRATLLISSASDGNCSGASTGNLSLAGNSSFRTAEGMEYDVAVIAQGDIYYRGGATVQGAILAQEQIDYRGNADSYGPVIAKGACNTPGSPVSGSKISGSVLSGNSFISYPGDVRTPFISLRLETEVIAWYEL